MNLSTYIVPKVNNNRLELNEMFIKDQSYIYKGVVQRVYLIQNPF